jgi:hypothetical protein
MQMATKKIVPPLTWLLAFVGAPVLTQQPERLAPRIHVTMFEQR